MSFFAIGEPEYKNSNWYKNIVHGLVYEKRQKRLTLTILNHTDELKDLNVHEEDVIFVIGTHSEWLSKTIQLCEAKFNNRVIVLGNHEHRLHKRKYSIVTGDISHNVQVLYNYLLSHGKNRIAMYGINPNSTSDSFRKESFLACGAREDALFYNSQSLSQCYEDFSKKAEQYDGVICVNDYAAMSLIKHLGTYHTIFITSCSGTLLADFFSPSITRTQINFQMFGKTGIDLSRILQKNAHINSVKIYLSGNFIAGETTAFLPLVQDTVMETGQVQKEMDNFYSDSEINEMLKIEMLLNSCDDDDLLILEQVLRNETYSAISDHLFMSVSGVKYKLKNMFQLCDVNSRAEFIQLLSKYMKLDT